MHSYSSSQDSSNPQNEQLFLLNKNKKKRKNYMDFQIPDALSTTSAFSSKAELVMDTADSSHHLDCLEIMNVPTGSYSCPSENYGNKKSNFLPPEEAQHFENYLKFLPEKHPSFFSALLHDPDGTAKNFFWTDQNSIIDYKYLGDVLILDTTILELDKYHMICARFFGLNHHQQYILFGCGLLLDETIDSLVWLLETFVKAMDSDQQPKTIFSDDENLAMANAIKEVLPEAKHLIGLWYIHRNAAKRLSEYNLSLFYNLFEQWVFESPSEKEFKSKWFSLLDQFNLHGNPWLNKLYLSKKNWAPLFNKKTFVAGIRDAAAGIDSIFSKEASYKGTLEMFVDKYLIVLDEQHKEESHQDLLSKENDREFFLKDCLIEEQAACVYTWTMFKMFQKELVECLLLEIEEITTGVEKFRITDQEDGNQYIVEFNCLDSSAACCCRKYDSIGILCRHVLRVFRERNVFQIPSNYILRRWTKTAKVDMVGRR